MQKNYYSIPKPKIKYIRESQKELRILSVPEQTALESFLYNDINTYKFGILLALYTGIRLGELCALRWEDVDSEKIRINVMVVSSRACVPLPVSPRTCERSTAIRKLMTAAVILVPKVLMIFLNIPLNRC